MTNKERYEKFCESTYVPIYSKSWWMDAVCGPDNWDVWLYESGGEILAAMPYYMERRGKYKYITKAPLTQNNGIIFKYDPRAKLSAELRFEEKVINSACVYIAGLGVDVYEQQYQYSFQNWLPFFWNYYTQITRYTYVVEDTSDLDAIWNNIEKSRRNRIKKGQQNTTLHEGMSPEEFYRWNETVYTKQGLITPFSYDLWERLYKACVTHNSGKILYRTDSEGNVACISFIVWDDQFVYKLIGGAIPDRSFLEAHSAMTWNQIEFAHKHGLKFDFEGSVIKRISKSFREYGGIPKAYFRIRKVFNEEILRKEAEEQIARIRNEKMAVTTAKG